MDTSAARAAIFSRIRKAQARPDEPTEAERAAVRDYVSSHAQGPRPEIGNDLLVRFQEQAVRMSDTVDVIETEQEVPAAVARFLTQQGLTCKAVAWSTLDALDWESAGVEIAFRPPVNEDLVGITGSFCAIAETGTLMLLSGPRTWSSASLLPETHIAVVRGSRIVAAMEDAFALVRSEHGALPRAVNLISGPSRTGDIEQTIVLGAHGPYRVHVIIVLGA